MGVWYLNGVRCLCDKEFFYKKLNKNITFWVCDNLTFYKILELLENDWENMIISFYEQECRGFRLRNLCFKQKEMKSLSFFSLPKENYIFTYGAYAIQILTQLIKQKKVKTTTLDQHTAMQIRGAYIGGRNEYIEEPNNYENLYSLDFNLMYYNCLKTNFISGAILKKKTLKIEEPGFYYITYESKDFKYPILYYKNELTLQNFFCNGVGEGLYWHEEIELFIQEGGIVYKIHFMYGGLDYTKNYQAFIEKLDECGDRKTKKKLANNLYGRLAMKDYIYRTKLCDTIDFFLLNEQGLLKDWWQWNELYICTLNKIIEYKGHTNIATAAALTSKARIKIYKLMLSLQNKVQICLINTDEIICVVADSSVFVDCEAIKIRPISKEEFIKKKQMFFRARFNVDDTHTRAYNIYNNMLL